jgi:A/G-specific adenine glycosylase
VKARKTAITAVDEHAFWLRDGTGRVLLHHEAGKRRTGLWKLPVREAAEIAGLPVIAEHRYAITRYKVSLHVHDGNAAGALIQEIPGDCWKHPDEALLLPMAAPFRRVLERLLEDF